MCHGLCFLPELFIEPFFDRIICPACPKGKGGNKVGWNNLERHFRKVHTNSPEMIKLICQGCGSISVHLKDVHEHKTCTKYLKRIKSKETEEPSKRRKFDQNTPQTVRRQNN